MCVTGCVCAMQELNIDAEEVESLMVSCILDSTVHGRIDQVQQILEVDHEPQGSARYATLHFFCNAIKRKGGESLRDSWGTQGEREPA